MEETVSIHEVWKGKRGKEKREGCSREKINPLTNKQAAMFHLKIPFNGRKDLSHQSLFLKVFFFHLFLFLLFLTFDFPPFPSSNFCTPQKTKEQNQWKRMGG